MSILDLDSSFFRCFNGISPECSLYHEDVLNKKDLLVTIGDSWTWGDSVGSTSYRYGVSDPNRTNLIYGKHLQQLIGDCDWVNIACPGTANQWIVDSALRFINLSHKLNYQKIYLIVGLTDMTRDHAQRGFHRDSDNKFLESLRLWERDYFLMLNELANVKNIVPIVSRNFTNSFSDNLEILPFHLTKRWIDVSADHWDGFVPGYTVGMIMPTKLPDLEEQRWAIDEGIPQSMQVIKFLDQCPLHYKKATKHPTEKSHRFWAEYVYTNLTKNRTSAIL